MKEAINEAEIGLEEGGIPIGSILVHNNQIVGRGHNQRVQKGNPLLHGEMDALQNAGRQGARFYRECIIYTTLSPCIMCSGTIVHYKIPLVIIGENETTEDTTLCEDFLLGNNIELINLNLEQCKLMMRDFIQNNEELWFEDISI
jgi:cytosine deaminase